MLEKRRRKRKGKQVNIEERNQKELDKLYRAMGV